MTSPRRRWQLPPLGVLGGLLVACTPEPPAPPTTPAQQPAAIVYPASIRAPTNHGGLDVTDDELSTTPAAIACATCHQDGSAPALAKRPGAPEVFHDRASLRHGTLTCRSCHSPDNPEHLVLADHTAVPMRESMRLCGQCHGTQLRDYNHGAHGGMRGYWDVTRGPRERNHCVTCHPAHAPRYPQVIPAPPPRDRFVTRAPHEAPPRLNPGAHPQAREGADHE